MKHLTVGTEPSYKIMIGGGALDLLPETLEALRPERVAVLTDENVWRLHGERLRGLLEGRAAQEIVLPAGEETKSLAVLGDVYGRLARERFGRGDLLLAFGGGVIGDLCGFAAATYMRGVRYLQLPSTLLAQVDSGVGGKTAVNLPEGKNLVGAFYQPRAVLMDQRLLETLPRREWHSGLAEMFKYGAIASPALLEALAGWEGDPAALEEMIVECCRRKKALVEEDERDTGRRMLLNFGHTFGHAIEAMGAFREHRHGEAVAMGMVLAAGAGERLGVTAAGTAAQLAQALGAQGIPTRCPYPLPRLTDYIRGDKKAGADRVNLVLLEKIGQAKTVPIGYNELTTLLEGMDPQ